MHFLYGMWFDVCMSLNVHFSWGVTLVGIFFTGHYSLSRGEIFSSTGGTLGKDTGLRAQL